MIQTIINGDYQFLVDTDTGEILEENPLWCGATYDQWKDLYESAIREDDI